MYIFKRKKLRKPVISKFYNMQKTQKIRHFLLCEILLSTSAAILVFPERYMIASEASFQDNAYVRPEFSHYLDLLRC